MKALLLAAACVAGSAPALIAQVGFQPSASPYHEITHGSYVEGTVGRIYGGGGMFQLGPRNGTSVGVRYVLRGKNTIQFSLGGWTAKESWIVFLPRRT